MADVTDADFETAVVERSKTVPVVVDLWAPWCGPCKMLGPILEEVIGETQGLVELAKVDVDQNPAVHQAFQVQGIPAVYAMIDGQVVDGFMGAKPKHVIVEFVQGLLDIKAGIVTNPTDDVDEATSDGGEESAVAPAEGISTPAPVEPVISEPGGDVAPPAPAISAAEADAIEEQLTDLLTKVKSDDDAREEFLSLLTQLGPEDPRTGAYRRKLTTALF